MIKTLYVRVVLTYIAAVLFGLVCSFFVTISMATLLKEQVDKHNYSTLYEMGQAIIAHLTTASGFEEAEASIRAMKHIQNYEMRLISRQGIAGEYSPQGDAPYMNVGPEDIASALNGEPYWNAKTKKDRDAKTVIGLPFQLNGERYALFLQLSSKAEDKMISTLVLFTLIVSLIAGSLFIMIAARYLVHPLRAMKEATKRIAAGDFQQLDLNWASRKRKDELIGLAQSFNEMAREIQKMEQMRRDFVSNVSHEIQSPLTSISGFSKILRKSNVSEEERNRYLDIIQTQSERLSRLSDNLLRLASLESEHHPFEPQTFDIDEQIRMIVVSCEPQWAAKQIEMELDLPRAKIVADADQLSQVWINLLGNAIKFTPEHGKITVSLHHETNRLSVTITDNGIGIGAEDRERIFERFFQADPSRTKQQSGSGLGLAIVKKIVTLHQGAIHVDSAPGKGTAITVELPAAPPFSGKPKPKPPLSNL
ncbi:MAG: histidine kinase [Paenibacillus sp.]|nr:histidine kinase [Paenibacillus sp.]